MLVEFVCLRICMLMIDKALYLDISPNIRINNIIKNNPIMFARPVFYCQIVLYFSCA